MRALNFFRAVNLGMSGGPDADAYAKNLNALAFGAESPPSHG